MTQDVGERGGFVFAGGSEGVNAWQIDDFGGASICEGEVALFFLNRHTGPVANLLMGASEAIKKGRFAAVGIANEADGKGFI